MTRPSLLGAMSRLDLGATAIGVAAVKSLIRWSSRRPEVGYSKDNSPLSARLKKPLRLGSVTS